jgi:hypothetical protein
MLNPAEVTLTIAAAIKNMTTNSVFYFTLPVSMEALFGRVPAMDINAFAGAWKGLDESHEASAVASGKLSMSGSA